MAKARRRTKSKIRNSRLVRRDISNIAKPRLHDLTTSLSLANTHSLSPSTPSTYYSDVQDYRRWNPDPYEVPFTTRGLPSRVVISKTPVRNPGRNRNATAYQFSQLSPRIVFAQPAKTLTCIRRARRKAVIHAYGIAGTRTAKPKFNNRSKLSCRR